MLSGKNAIITGARQGIGRATTEIFAGYGANIWACARKQDAAFEEDMAALAEKFGVCIRPMYFDLSREGEIKAGVKKILAEKLPVDILVNNAGMAHCCFLQMTSLDAMKEVFQINYFSQMLITQQVSRLMIRQKRGTIVNLSSVEGLLGNAGYSAYGASKAALAFSTKVLAKELAPYGIRVNAVAPGLLDTEMGAQMEQSARDRMLDSCALHRLGTTGEVAETIAFLASDKAPYITGQVIRIDGGM